MVSNDADISSGVRSVVLSGDNTLYAQGAFTKFGDTTTTLNGLGGISINNTTQTASTLTNFLPSGDSMSAGGQLRAMSASGDGSKLYLAYASASTNWKSDNIGGTVNRAGVVQLDTSTGFATNFNFTLAPDAAASFLTQAVGAFVIGDSVYITGDIGSVSADGDDDRSNNVARQKIAKYNNANSSALTLDTTFAPTDATNGAGSSVRRVIQVGDDLYITGDFSQYGGVQRDGIAAISATTGLRDDMWNLNTGPTSSDRFGGNGTRIVTATVGGTNVLAANTGLGANGVNTQLAGPDGVFKDAHYYGAFTALGNGGGATPEPGSAFLLIPGLVTGAGVWVRRRRTGNH